MTVLRMLCLCAAEEYMYLPILFPHRAARTRARQRRRAGGEGAQHRGRSGGCRASTASHQLLKDKQVNLEAGIETSGPGQQLERLFDVLVLLGLQTYPVVGLPDAL